MSIAFGSEGCYVVVNHKEKNVETNNLDIFFYCSH